MQWTARDSNSERDKRFYLFQNVQTGFEVHSASYSVDVGVSFAGRGKAGGV
jgi:hypothetical protein